MFISAFTFIRNAVKLDYPVLEAITNLLPIVDEFVVNIGRLGDEPDDGTEKLIASLNSPKIRVVHSQWNPQVTKGAYVYAQQTNIALMNCQGQWAMYVQCDEILHEQYFDMLVEAMKRHRDNAQVDALSIDQLNFWGDYQTIFDVYPWNMRRKCWIVKPHHFVLSRGDGANFTVHPKYKERGRKLRILETPAVQFHYGAIKTMDTLASKRENEHRFWAPGETKDAELSPAYYYQTHPRQFVSRFEGSHPAVMEERIGRHQLRLDLNDPSWRTQLTAAERKLVRKGWFARTITDRWSNRSDYKLLGKA